MNVDVDVEAIASAATLVEGARHGKLRAAPQDSLSSGSLLANGRLTIVRTIGHGGMGVVYEAYDHERACPVALKQLKSCGPSAVYGLKNEFRSLLNVSHPNLVRFQELFCNHDECFFTMDLVDGEPFDWWVRLDAEFCEERTRSAFGQLLAAVSAIHEAGKLHRDLKPSNVLVTREGRVVVLDFGLVSDSELGGVGQTLPDASQSGTPAYMAPEQALGLHPTVATDLYALGVMLFEALTGRLPFDGNTPGVLLAKQQRSATWPEDLTTQVPEDLRLACMQLLAREPIQRPSLTTLQIQFAVPSIAPPRVSKAPSGMLLGRAAEWAVLSEAYNLAVSGTPSVVIMAGESGIGKSALCEAFLQKLRSERRAVVLSGRCYERESVPFKAIDPLIDELTRHLRRLSPEAAAALLPRDAAALVQLFPVLGRVSAFANAPDRNLRDPRELRRSAFSAFCEVLARLRDRGPLVIYVDDLQWTDADSVALLRYMFIRPREMPVLFIGSHRTEGADTCSLLQGILTAADSNPAAQVRRIQLGPLAVGDAELLVRRLLGATAPVDDLIGTIARESRGSPFFVSELARFACSTDGPSLARVSMTAVLDARFESLSLRARALLELLALAGCPLSTDVALAAAGASHSDLDELREANLVRASAPIASRAVECFHDRIREGVCAMLSDMRCRALYAGLSTALQNHASADAELLSRCLEGAGDRNAAAEQAAIAADQAAAALAFEHAATLYRRALELGNFERPRLLTLTNKLGLTLENAGRGMEAASVYELAAGLCSGDDSLDYRRRAADQLLATGHVSRGSALLREVCSELDVHFPSNASVAALSSGWTHLRLRLHRVDLDRPATRVAGPRELLQLRTARTAVTGLSGYLPLQAAAVAGRYLLQAQEVGDIADRVRALGFNAFTSSLIDPQSHVSAELLARLEALAASDGSPELIAFANFMHGTGAYHWDRFRVAREYLAQCTNVLRNCVGTEWENDAAHVYDQMSATHAGDYADIARTTPGLVDEAFRRGRVWAGTMLSGYTGMTAWLVSDDATGYRRQLDDVRSRWRQQDQEQWPDYLLLIGEAYLSLYRGDPIGSCALLDRQGQQRGGVFKTAGTSKRWYAVHRGRCAAAALSAVGVDGRRDPRPYIATLTQSKASLLRHGRGTSLGFAASFEGAMALHAGQRESALAALRRALAYMESSGLGMHAAAIQRRLGQLLGGDKGARLLLAGDTFMRAQSVKNLEPMTELHCPGYNR